MSLDLSNHGRSGVCRELHPARRIEPIYRVQQAEASHLNQIVYGFTSPREAPSQILGKRQEHRHKLLTHGRRVFREASEQLALVGSVAVE
jgi:hypothetical protein